MSQMHGWWSDRKGIQKGIRKLIFMLHTKNASQEACVFHISPIRILSQHSAGGVAAHEGENAWIYSVSLQKMCIFVIYSSGT